MTFTTIYSPAWANAEHSAINLLIDTDSGQYPTIPFTASPTDNTDYGPQIYQAAANGVFGDVAEYVAPAPNPVQIVASNTRTFNRLLVAATAAAFPLQSAVTLGKATQEDQDALAALQQYSIDLAETKLDTNPVAWPPLPAGVKLPL